MRQSYHGRSAYRRDFCGGESFHELNGVWLATVEHQLIHIGRAVVVPLEIHREAAEQV